MDVNFELCIFSWYLSLEYMGGGVLEMNHS
jgi:hypothetical protein